MNTQTHIVYRNRIEHDFYESGMLIPLIGGLAFGLMVFLLLMGAAGKIKRNYGAVTGWILGSSAVVSLCAGWLVLKWLLI